MSSDTRANLGGYRMTVMRTASEEHAAAKVVEQMADGSVISTDYSAGASYWISRPVTLQDHEALAAWLRRQARDWREMSVLGELLPHVDPTVPHLRRWASDILSQNTLTAMYVLRWGFPVDVDDAPVPEGLGDPERFVEGGVQVRDHHMPPVLRGASCVISPSASSGRRGPGLWRGRLWFLLDAPVLLVDLRRWAKGAAAADYAIDPVLYQAGQPVFLARPAFTGGLVDPMTPDAFATVARGDRERVVLDVTEFDKCLVQVETKLRSARIAAGSDWRRLLADTLGADGFFTPLTAALGVAAKGDEPIEAICDFTVALLNERADPTRRGRYDRRWVAGTVKRFRALDTTTQRRIARAKSRLLISREDGHE